MNKLTTLFFVLMLMITSTILAQENTNAKMKPLKLQKFSVEQRAKNATDTLQKVTGLTDVQYQKVYDINLSYFTQKRAIKSQMRTDTIAANDAQYKEQEKQITKTRKAEIEKLLTPEQKTKWQEYKKSHAEKVKSNMQKGKFNKEDEDDAIFDGM